MRRFGLALATFWVAAMGARAVAQEQATEHLAPREKIGSVVSLDVYTHSERLHSTIFSGMTDHRGVSYLVSADNGNTWSTPFPLGEDKGQHSDLASMGRDLVTIYDVTDPDDGLVVGVKTSPDEGATWSAFSRLSPKGVKADFPRLVSVKGRFVAFWTEKDKTGMVTWRMRVLGAALGKPVEP